MAVIQFFLTGMLRQLTEQDLLDMQRIEAICQKSPWSMDIFQKCMDAGSQGWVLEQEGQIIGFILVLFQMDEVHILNFCVHPIHQHKGLGRSLLIHALEHAALNGAKFVYLEVRRSNHHAISLYEKAGFIKVGERKDYYLMPEPSEDALVFAMKLVAE